jgi:GTP pyrophosphokinase
MPDGEWAYSHRFLLALDAAATMHAAQRRKGSGVPYISHLLGTCAIAMEYGADEDEAIAALLHDAIEEDRSRLIDVELRQDPVHNVLAA